MDGFRLLGIRWWRRNLPCTFVAWKALRSFIQSTGQGSLITTTNTLQGDKTGIKYVWKTGRKGPPNIGRKRYAEQHRSKYDLQDLNKSRAVAMYGIRRAAGPYC